MDFHKTNRFCISKPFDIPDEIMVKMENYNYLPESPSNSKFMKVGIVGPVNAGKSTLLNKIVGKQISAASPKRNTTYETMDGIITCDKTNSQILLHDIPGFARLEKQKVECPSIRSQKELPEMNKLLLIVDGNVRPKETWVKDITFLKALSENGPGIILVVNKMDLIFNKRRLTDIIDMFENYLNFEKTFMISGETGFGVESLIEYLHSNNSPGMWSFPSGASSKLSEFEIIQEIIKSALFERTYNELPYDLHYDVMEFFVTNTHVKLVIQVSTLKKHQVQILIGNEGRNVRAIREMIQVKLAQMYNRVVNVGITVVVGRNNNEKLFISKDSYIGQVENNLKVAKNSIKTRKNVAKLLK